jgi:Domain of unknown function (DUF4157)
MITQSLFGRPYPMPKPVIAALERVFDMPVSTVKVVEHSVYARCHLGMLATTRRNTILLAIGGDEFISDPQLLLHEYFHVVRQWNTGRLTRSGYLIESLRYGYRDNRFELEARDFTAHELERYRL